MSAKRAIPSLSDPMEYGFRTFGRKGLISERDGARKKPAHNPDSYRDYVWGEYAVKKSRFGEDPSFGG